MINHIKGISQAKPQIAGVFQLSTARIMHKGEIKEYRYFTRFFVQKEYRLPQSPSRSAQCCESFLQPIDQLDLLLELFDAVLVVRP
jgi:hypothetical protein